MTPQTIAHSTMVGEKPHEVADRPQGLLNPRYRRYLLGESDIEPHTQPERDVRASIRQRLFHGLLDFSLIYQFLEQRDVNQSIGNVDGEERLSRDTAIANAIALFLDLGSSEELADTAEFERHVERAAKLSWHARHDAVDDSNVWLGEPHVDLTIQHPDRIDFVELIDKTLTIWMRIVTEESPPHQNSGEQWGLDSLSSDEVLYMLSLLSVGADLDDQDPAAADLLRLMEEVTQYWITWQQQTRQNLPDSSLENLIEMRRDEEWSALDLVQDYLADESADNS